jgi:hypothetical protein
MPTHLVFESVARRLDAGTYSPSIVARMPVAAPSSPVASVSEPWWTYAAAGLMGAVIGLMLGGAR